MHGGDYCEQRLFRHLYEALERQLKGFSEVRGVAQKAVNNSYVVLSEVSDIIYARLSGLIWRVMARCHSIA